MKSAKVALDIAKVSVTDAKEALKCIDEIIPRHSNSGQNSCASRPNSRRDYSQMVNPTNQANSQDDPKEVARTNLQNAIDNATSKESVYNYCKSDLQTFRSSNLTTVDEFVQHGMNSVNRLFLDFKRLFIAQNGDYHIITSAYTTAEVLNPIAAVSMMSVLEISNALKNLGSHFEFDEFRARHGIIDDMILEINAYKAIAMFANDEFWNNSDGSSEYDEKLATRIGNGTIGDDVTWKDDPIESARHVWEFWRVHRKNVKIFHNAQAARLIALVQISSARVEKIFSQMKLIRDSCGDSLLEEALFGRVCERCNTYEVLQRRGRDCVCYYILCVKLINKYSIYVYAHMFQFVRGTAQPL
jgi:hypothetical protein